MLESRASQSPGTIFGFVLIAGLALLDLGLLFLLTNEPVTFLSFLWGALLLVSLPAVGFIAFWTSSLGSTRYHVFGDALVIEWGRIQQVVPIAQIRSIVRGEVLREVKRFRGVRWPGCYVGHGQVTSHDGSIIDQETIFYATRPLRAQLLLVTNSVAYGLSPVDLDNFADCLRALRVPEFVGGNELPASDLGPLNWRLWQEGGMRLIITLAGILNFALFAYLCAIYSRLPATVPLHFDGSGVVDRIGNPIGLFVLPLLGLLAWLANGALGWAVYQIQGEKPIAYLLWGSAVLVQLVTWIAVIVLLA
jgi:hypothetical protein